MRNGVRLCYHGTTLPESGRESRPHRTCGGTGEVQSERVREALVKLRQNARLTQRQLAKKLRREHSLISRLELGERRVDVVEFFWICQACGADPARAASTLMRQFAKIQSDSPGSQ